LLLGWSTVHAQHSLTGTWLGKIGGSLTVIFHFTTAANGQTSGTIDVPQQGATGLPLKEVAVLHDSLICAMNAPQATYAAMKLNDSAYLGSWIQGPARVVLEIHRLSGAAAAAYAPPVRLQTPMPPYPYHSDSVEYDNAAGTVHLGATLTYPTQGGPFPTAVLITGSGIQDRDETVFAHHPFAVIADYLTRRGYAVLRVDDRTAGLSRGDVIQATSADFADDVETSLAYLRKRKEVDTTRLGLIGHSEGAMIAPMVAARDKSLYFIILLASPAEGGYATMGYQTLKPMQNVKASEPAIEAAVIREKILLDNMIKARDADEFVRNVDAQYRYNTAKYKDSSGNYPSFIISPDQLKTALTRQAPILVQPWWKFFLTYDPAPDFGKLSCFVLALGGDKDIQVDNPVDLPLIQQLVSPSEKGKVTTRLLPGLNHLFQHCHTCTVDEYGKLEETFAPDALALMAGWLDTFVRKR
jgi:pimeloyl-ACP methyl ester carboxylesterase